jgi:hypothetical protein
LGRAYCHRPRQVGGLAIQMRNAEEDRPPPIQLLGLLCR